MPDTWKQRLAAWKQRFRAFGKATFSVAVALVGIAGVGAGAFAIYFYWNWLNPVIMGNNPEHLRNLILMTAGLITFIISIWRAQIADKQAKASNIQAEATIEQIKIAAQSQITDRFTRAIEQLGKSGDDILFLRIGAIQALERIGNDSLGDLPAVIRLLAGFSRQTSIAWYESIRNQEGQVVVTPLDVAEAVRALARLNDKHLEFLREQEIFIDLSRACLQRLDLPNSNLSGFDFGSCNLSNANLNNANLSDAKLWNANFSNASFWGANLSRANGLIPNFSNAILWYANFSNTSLMGANFNNAKLPHANLSKAILDDVNFSSATLGDANLSNASLRNANLSNAYLQATDLSGANIEYINSDMEPMNPQEEMSKLLSEIKYDKDNPPVNCPEGVELPPPRDG
ncbi:MAG: pentapeptide repeat-containing protein [Deltaproteobacteria bacterium]|nr:pentapeptide repeat-containing protein [Deltaproteobacteria bacterium]